VLSPPSRLLIVPISAAPAWLATGLDAARLGALASIRRRGEDQVTLELGEAVELGHHRHTAIGGEQSEQPTCTRREVREEHPPSA